MTNPKISVIVPCYNQAQYLDECLESIFNQTYENWECIIIDDGSLDYTAKVARKWTEKDCRYIYLYKENGGLSSARNAGLDIAKGDYIQFLDADDCLSPQKISKSLAMIKDHSLDNIVVTHFKMFKDSTNDLLTSYCQLNQDILQYNEILFGWDFKFNIPIHCGFFSSALFRDFHFPIDLKAKEDWLMWLVFFQRDVQAVFIEEILAYYRTHDKSMTKSFPHMLEYTIAALDNLENIIPKEDYKLYLLYNIRKRIIDGENSRLLIAGLKERIVTSHKSLGYRIEKKIRNFFR
ncbi:glycosyltransferase family 2 protein [Flavobacterium branchiicola]|uniref:Glycosyltransferase family 2 protein n=1 Tax=Flavobacterium branchiicola TaxID=1114875 RepID=A0ABV9PJG5_9FLAO|nr:glycosyltransferase family 2 protein [Flavobacterium branchiicola]MBS7255477.1 glycosyltransferase family 2 protein [Flavobacterium branchiicola]